MRTTVVPAAGPWVTAAALLAATGAGCADAPETAPAPTAASAIPADAEAIESTTREGPVEATVRVRPAAPRIGAFSSTSATTCLPACAASMSALMIGELAVVRYRVILMARTFGSRAARVTNVSTVDENESYGW